MWRRRDEGAPSREILPALERFAMMFFAARSSDYFEATLGKAHQRDHG
jgi:hypothetical protein